MTLSSLDIATVGEAHDLLSGLGCHVTGNDIMAPKAVFLVIRVSALLPQAANILKQEMLAKGGEAAVPSGALNMEARRVDCIVMGTLAQYGQLVETLKQQPFELSELAPQLSMFAGLSFARPLKHWLGAGADAAIGGLVDCDLQSPGVHDHNANAVAFGWNLLEERSDFLVVTGSSIAVVRNVAQQLADSAACPVAAWALNSPPVGITPAMPLVVQQGYGPATTNGAVLAICTGEGSTEFIEGLMEAEVGSERLFITAALGHMQADTISINPAPASLPRLDAVLVRQQDIATLSTNEQTTIVTRLVDRGASVFISDAPRHIRELLKATRHDPWNSSPTQK